MFKKVIYNTASQIAAKAATASSTLIITIIIGKSLGPAGYGDFTKAFTFVGYFYTVADFGFNAIYIKLASKFPADTLLRSLVGLRLIIAVFLAATAISLSFVLPHNPSLGIGFSPIVKAAILIASLTIVTQALFTSVNAFFQKNLRYDLSAIASVVGTLVILIFTVFAALSKSNLLVYAMAYVAGGVIFVLVSYTIILKKFKLSVTPQVSKEFYKKFFLNSWPIGMALFFNLIYFRVDIFILASTKSSIEVGLYGMAYQFFEAALAIPIFFSNALYPLLSNLFHDNQAEYKKQIKSWAFFLLIFSFILAGGLLIAATLIPYIMGQNFAPSKAALMILALGIPFFFISALFWHMLIIQSKQKMLIAVYLFGALFNITTNMIFIPKYGFIAASVVTVASEAIIAILLFLVLRTPFKSYPRLKSLPPIGLSD